MEKVLPPGRGKSPSLLSFSACSTETTTSFYALPNPAQGSVAIGNNDSLDGSMRLCNMEAPADNGVLSPSSGVSKQTKIQLMPSIDEFSIIKDLSSGAFGRVVLARYRGGAASRSPARSRIYAVKIMEKIHMLNKNMADRVNNEKNALAISHSDFVVRIFYCLQSRSRVYLVMEYMIGGDLKKLLRKFTVFPEAVAKFYLAECALALEYIHGHGIIHRDVKPDNVLIGRNGHIKLTDFGLCSLNRKSVEIGDIIATPLPQRGIFSALHSDVSDLSGGLPVCGDQSGSRGGVKGRSRKRPVYRLALQGRTPGQLMSLTTNIRMSFNEGSSLIFDEFKKCAVSPTRQCTPILSDTSSYFAIREIPLGESKFRFNSLTPGFRVANSSRVEHCDSEAKPVTDSCKNEASLKETSLPSSCHQLALRQSSPLFLGNESSPASIHMNTFSQLTGFQTPETTGVASLSANCSVGPARRKKFLEKKGKSISLHSTRVNKSPALNRYRPLGTFNCFSQQDAFLNGLSASWPPACRVAHPLSSGVRNATIGYQRRSFGENKLFCSSRCSYLPLRKFFRQSKMSLICSEKEIFHDVYCSLSSDSNGQSVESGDILFRFDLSERNLPFNHSTWMTPTAEYPAESKIFDNDEVRKRLSFCLPEEMPLEPLPPLIQVADTDESDLLLGRRNTELEREWALTTSKSAALLSSGTFARRRSTFRCSDVNCTPLRKSKVVRRPSIGETNTVRTSLYQGRLSINCSDAAVLSLSVSLQSAVVNLLWFSVTRSVAVLMLASLVPSSITGVPAPVNGCDKAPLYFRLFTTSDAATDQLNNSEDANISFQDFEQHDNFYNSKSLRKQICRDNATATEACKRCLQIVGLINLPCAEVAEPQRFVQTVDDLPSIALKSNVSPLSGAQGQTFCRAKSDRDRVLATSQAPKVGFFEPVDQITYSSISNSGCGVISTLNRATHAAHGSYTCVHNWRDAFSIGAPIANTHNSDGNIQVTASRALDCGTLDEPHVSQTAAADQRARRCSVSLPRSVRSGVQREKNLTVKAFTDYVSRRRRLRNCDGNGCGLSVTCSCYNHSLKKRHRRQLGARRCSGVDLLNDCAFADGLYTRRRNHRGQQASNSCTSSGLTDPEGPNVIQHFNTGFTEKLIAGEEGFLLKKNANITGGIVGTPDYLAPEVLKGELHTSAVDIWSLGICLYEFLVGCPPFIDETVEKVFDNIINRAIEYPNPEEYADDVLSDAAVKTIESLLDPCVSRRPSATSIRSLPLFVGFDFDNVRSMPPPWLPSPRDEDELTLSNVSEGNLRSCVNLSEA